ncbi:hypothetical protein E2C01_007275 [Portunus trituberculatus]|uniref:Uncharacterized protein n=1 Tax=Portunus trituberculatus TaxID=210409 RepID=A0A5B7CZ05_PORTR|nr:hypothetical protein [Portunus trituberculatus]
MKLAEVKLWQHHGKGVIGLGEERAVFSVMGKGRKVIVEMGECLRDSILASTVKKAAKYALPSTSQECPSPMSCCKACRAYSRPCMGREKGVAGRVKAAGRTPAVVTLLTFSSLSLAVFHGRLRISMDMLRRYTFFSACRGGILSAFWKQVRALLKSPFLYWHSPSSFQASGRLKRVARPSASSAAALCSTVAFSALPCSRYSSPRPSGGTWSEGQKENR